LLQADSVDAFATGASGRFFVQLCTSVGAGKGREVILVAHKDC
jgi:hypothetical protein